jgi:fucose permease
MPYARVSWLCAIFLLGYVGVEVSLGGWVVQFMIRVRNANSFDAGMASVGFWLGLTIGRATLGLLTPSIGVKLSLLIFIPLTMGLELVFWLVPQFHVSAVAIAFGGSGAAVLPFAIGAIAQSQGVQVLQPIILSILGALLILWLALPKTWKRED